MHKMLPDMVASSSPAVVSAWARWGLFRMRYVLMFLVAPLLGIWGLESGREDKEQLYLEQYVLELGTIYQASLVTYERATTLLIDETLRKPEIRELLKAAKSAEEEDKIPYRAQLFKLLSPSYRGLREQGVRQFHFHGPDGTSFLRFHEPRKYGDDLLAFRPTIRLAQEKRQVVKGFEAGKVRSGFRYVFPIEEEGELLGSVETSIGFRMVRDTMASLAPSREFYFVLSKERTQSIARESETWLYGQATIHPDFVVEDPQVRLPDSPPPPTPEVLSLNEKLSQLPEVLEGMRHFRTFSLALTQEKEPWVVSFLPVYDVEGTPSAYILSYAKAPLITVLQREFWGGALVLCLFFAGLGYLLVHLLRSRDHLAQEQQNLVAITETMGDGLYVLDQNGKVVLVNAAALRILKFERNELLGKTGHELFHQHGLDGTLPLHECPIFKAVSAGRHFFGEEQFTRRDKSVVRVEVSSTPLYRGQVLYGSVTAFRDITQRKEDEAKLRAAIDAAEAASRAKGAFVANMSHEIRTPMNGIMGLTALTLETELTASQRQYLELVMQSAESLTTILNDILDFSKMEAGKMELEQTPFGLRELTLGACRVLSSKAAEKKLEILLDVPPEIPESLVGDPGRLRQVLLNLLGNAIKFTASGHITLKVSLSSDGDMAEMSRKTCLRFSVMDTGVGIPAEKLTTIFEAFGQADVSVTRRFGGTGLGLTISRQIIRLMGGELEAESTVGEGSHFYFDVCLGRNAGLDGYLLPVVRDHQKRWLVMLEHEELRRLLVSRLRGYGLEVTEVAGVEDLINLSGTAAVWSVMVLETQGLAGDPEKLVQIRAGLEVGGQVLGLSAPHLGQGAEPRSASTSAPDWISRELLKPVLPETLLFAVAELEVEQEKNLRTVSAPALPSTEESASPEPAAGLKILLVEDNKVNQKLATQLLKKRGHEIVLAENGVEALEQLAVAQFDLVLMDVQMPVMDGLEATRQFRRQEGMLRRDNPAVRRMPIIAMTANAMVGDREDCLTAGMDGYISKPIQIALVDQEIRRVLRDRQEGELHVSKN